MQKPLAVIACAVFLSCASGFGQAAAPIASADPAVVAATRDLLTAMKMREVLMVMLADSERRVPEALRAITMDSIDATPNMTLEDKAAAMKELDKTIENNSAHIHAVFSDPTLVDDIIAETVPLYAETYTLDEIRQLTAFFASPVGQKMQTVTPALMARYTEISKRVLKPRAEKAMAQIQQAAAGK